MQTGSTFLLALFSHNLLITFLELSRIYVATKILVFVLLLYFLYGVLKIEIQIV